MEDLSERVATVQTKLDQIKDYFDLETKRARLEELRAASAAPDFWDDTSSAQQVMAESARLSEDVSQFDEIQSRLADARVLWELAEGEKDEATGREADEELAAIESEIESLEVLALLGGEFDDHPAIVEVHAGEGGTDSQDWADMLLRMYLRWAERRGFKADVLEVTPGEEAGIKGATLTVEGRHSYGLLAAERGVHRLVRISPFDASRRRHTSFASVDVTPEVDEQVEVEIDPDDLRIDTYRSSGAGGQHVNVTDSAVRITHLPTGIVVSCQNERSQMQNRAVAMRILKSRLLARALEEREQELVALRGEKREIGFGSQIRSYVLHPYQMVKDHRTGVETGNVQSVLDGDLDRFIGAELRRKAGGGEAPRASDKPEKPG
ncbi:MAG TPA: peptide chain release factor 2 [Actinomycetota bacterium]|nr:peptide chain release factor 2 [Actinomycetota bacterium]